MSSNVLVLPNHHQIVSPFVFSVLPGCYKKLQDSDLITEPKSYLHDCFRGDRFLFSAFESKKSGDVDLCIYIQNGVFRCRQSEDKQSFLLYDFYLSKPQDVTVSIQEGINIVSTYGTVLKITLKELEKSEEYYHNGKSIHSREANLYSSDTFSIIALVENECERLKNKRKHYLWNKNFQEDDNTEINTHINEFEEYLSLAENYALFEDEEAKKQVQQVRNILCYNPKPADYRRIDRIAYTFEIDDSFDYQNYKVNSKVELSINDERIVTATLINVNNSHKEITLLFDEVVDYKELPNMIQMALSYSDIMYETQIAAIDELRSDKLYPVNIDNSIGRFAPLEFKKYENEVINSRYFSKLNSSQLLAAEKGISFKDVLLIQGPPGTGKTTVITNLIEYYCIEKGYKVLISSQNNKAVDNVLERIISNKNINAIRAGSETKVSESIYPLLLENRLAGFRSSILDTVKNNIISLCEANELYSAILPNIISAKKCVQELISIQDKYSSVLSELKNSLTLSSKEYIKNKSANEAYASNHLEKAYRLCSVRDNSLRLKLVQTIINHQIKKELYTYELFCRRITNDQDIYKTKIIASIQRSVHAGICDFAITKDKLTKELASDLNAISKSLPNEQLSFAPLINDTLPFSFSNNALERYHVELDRLVKNAADITEKLNLLYAWENIVSNQNNYALSDALLESVNLVGATCIGINSQKKFRNTYYDIAIIDEAAQIQIQNILVPMSRAKKTILFGDHKQIPPIAKKEIIDRCIQEGIDTDLIETSLFERLFVEFPENNKVLLNTQYRMPREISDLLSHWFYEGKIITNKSDKTLILPSLFGSPFVILDTSNVKQRNESPNVEYSNRCEADLILKIIEYIYNDGDLLISSDNIGIITPYAEQVKLIRSRIAKNIDFPEIANSVSTVDSFQGQERDLIIYSCTRSNHYKYSSSRRIGFLAELRRLNVALSRAKKMLIFIGDIQFLRKCTGEQSKYFSQFIDEMYKYAQNGNAQIISAGEFILDLEGDA